MKKEITEQGFRALSDFGAFHEGDPVKGELGEEGFELKGDSEGQAMCIPYSSMDYLCHCEVPSESRKDWVINAEVLNANDPRIGAAEEFEVQDTDAKVPFGCGNPTTPEEKKCMLTIRYQDGGEEAWVSLLDDDVISAEKLGKEISKLSNLKLHERLANLNKEK